MAPGLGLVHPSCSGHLGTEPVCERSVSPSLSLCLSNELINLLKINMTAKTICESSHVNNLELSEFHNFTGSAVVIFFNGTEGLYPCSGWSSPGPQILCRLLWQAL